jgi:hypothetical protein
MVIKLAGKIWGGREALLAAAFNAHFHNRLTLQNALIAEQSDGSTYLAEVIRECL